MFGEPIVRAEITEHIQRFPLPLHLCVQLPFSSTSLPARQPLIHHQYPFPRCTSRPVAALKFALPRAFRNLNLDHYNHFQKLVTRGKKSFPLEFKDKDWDSLQPLLHLLLPIAQGLLS